MIREIVKDQMFLSQKSKECTIEDIVIESDLMDTLSYHQKECVGMAANMIGYLKKAIIFYDEKEKRNIVMFNPTIISCKDEYETEEGCLSLPGKRKTKRYKTITVSFQNRKFEVKKKTYHDFTAQIIQHEIDMTNGILI